MARHVRVRNIHCHVTDDQHAFLKHASADTGLHMADFVRYALQHTYGTWMDMDSRVQRNDTLSDMDDHGRDSDMAVHVQSSSADGFNGDMSGNADDMDAKRYAQAGLVGVRGKSAERISEWLAQRTRLEADTLKTLLGAYLVLSRLNSLRSMARRARGDD